MPFGKYDVSVVQEQIKKEKKLMIMVNDVSQYDILMNFIEDYFFDKDNFFVIISKTFSLRKH